LTDLGELATLRHLDLSRNQLIATPPGWFVRWTNMERLWLSHNQISTLPADDLGRMGRTLVELYLDHNKLAAVPAELAKLSRLRVLTLDENLIEELPAQLGTLTQLERLEVGKQQGHLRYHTMPFEARLLMHVCVRTHPPLPVWTRRSPPPEVVALGSGSIVAYLGQLLRGQEPCHRLKLMFVGQENVGYSRTAVESLTLIHATAHSRTCAHAQEDVAAACASKDGPEGEGCNTSGQTRGRDQPYTATALACVSRLWWH
jgi:hypothetical protein